MMSLGGLDRWSLSVSLSFSLWIVIFALELMMMMIVVVVIIIIDQTWNWNHYIFHVYLICCYLINCEFLMFRNSKFGVCTFWYFCLSHRELKIQGHLYDQQFFICLLIKQLIDQTTRNQSFRISVTFWLIHLSLSRILKKRCLRCGFSHSIWLHVHFSLVHFCRYSHWLEAKLRQQW